MRGDHPDEAPSVEGTDEARGVEAQEALAALLRGAEGLAIERPGLLELAALETAQPFHF